jgi:hypothetical protein
MVKSDQNNYIRWENERLSPEPGLVRSIVEELTSVTRTARRRNQGDIFFIANTSV